MHQNNKIWDWNYESQNPIYSVKAVNGFIYAWSQRPFDFKFQTSLSIAFTWDLNVSFRLSATPKFIKESMIFRFLCNRQENVWLRLESKANTKGWRLNNQKFKYFNTSATANLSILIPILIKSSAVFDRKKVEVQSAWRLKAGLNFTLVAI